MGRNDSWRAKRYAGIRHGVAEPVHEMKSNAPLHVLEFNEVEASHLARCLLSADLDRAIGVPN